MSMVTTCPQCRLQVTIPQGLPPDALVRCPLCNEEYRLREAFDLLPPDLIVLDAGAAVGALFGEAVEEAGVSTSQLPAVEFPGASETDGLPFFADDDVSDDPQGHVSLGDEAPAEGGAMIGSGGFDLQDSNPAASGSGTRFDFDFDGDDSGEGSVGLEAEARQRRQPNMLAEMIKVVLGGVLGLAIAYYILLWLGKDPFEIAGKLPPWLVP